jgi:hypothetical protein
MEVAEWGGIVVFKLGLSGLFHINALFTIDIKVVNIWSSQN